MNLLFSVAELQDFCRERWRLKEEQLREFYTGDWRSFVNPSDITKWTDSSSTSRRLLQAFSFLYFVPFTIVTLYYIFTVTSVLLYTIFTVLVLMAIGLYFGGLDVLQSKIT